VPEHQVLRQRLPPQIQIPKLQPQLLGRIRIVLDRKRRRVGAIENLDCARDDFHIARRHFRIATLRRAHHDFTFNAHDELGAQLFRDRDDVRRGAAAEVDDDLHDAAAIAEIDEHEIAEITPLLHPSVQRDRGLWFAKRSCVSASHHAFRYLSLYST